MNRTSAAMRYVWALLFSTQRWIAPALVLVGLIAWVWNTPPLGIDTVRITLLVLFALAAWLGHATGTVEEAGQELVSTGALGSARRLLFAKWTVASALAASFPVLFVAGSYAWSQNRVSGGSPPLLSTDQAWTSVLGVVVVAACGAALGILVASLVPAHPGWGATVLVLASLSQAVPGFAPVPIVADALPAPGMAPGVALLSALCAGVVLAAVLLMAGVAVRRPAG